MQLNGARNNTLQSLTKCHHKGLFPLRLRVALRGER